MSNIPKVTITVDVTASEIVEILSGIADIGVAKKYAKYYRRYMPAAVKTRPKKHKRAPATKKAKGERSGKPLKRGKRWTKKEQKWIAQYAKSNPINQKIIGAFKREFGYTRSYSSLANKAYALRRQ